MRFRTTSIVWFVVLVQACSLKDYTFQPVPSITGLTSSSNRLFTGETATLTPVFSDGTGSIDNGVGTVTSGTGYRVSPRADTTYTLSVTNTTGLTVTANVAIGVDTAPVVISAFTASPTQVNFGQPSTLSWTLTGRATSLMLDGVSVLGNTFQSVSPVRRQTYVLAGSNPLGGQTRNLTVAARGLDLLAGALGGPGSLDGAGSAARFSFPFAVAVDGAGNIYVADSVNNTIRKITPAGVVSTLAGVPGTFGSADGTTLARFSFPAGVAVDGSGNVYVADTGNHTIRKITSAGVVSTLAGLAGSSGFADGTTLARFSSPQGVAVDGSGNVYVADTSNCNIRKITQPAGLVSSLAGMPGSCISADGTGTVARFSFPAGIASDGSGTLYVADTGNHTIRKVVPAGALGTVSTLAGLAGTFGSAEGTGSVARFNSPGSVAVDGSGNLYVADSNNSTIRKVVPSGVLGTVSTLAGSAGSFGSAEGTGSAARFNLPQGAAVDASGNNVYVADTLNHTIRKVTPSGMVGTTSTPAGLATVSGSAEGPGTAARFNSPVGVAVDAAGNAYVADSSNSTIRAITSAGMTSTLAGSAGMPGAVEGQGSTARFRFPDGVAVDGSGNVYVADTSNHTIRKITSAGVASTLAGLAGTSGFADGTTTARFNFPRGVAVDGSGNVYVADTNNCTIRKITPAGVVSTLAGTPGSCISADGTGSVARFGFPQGIASDGSGNLYVADSNNHTLRKVVPSGAFGTASTLAGLAGTSGSADGTGNVARFNFPSGVAVDGSGNVYVADTNNHTIRKVTPSGAVGAVTTIAGSVTSFGALPGPLPASLYRPSGIALTPAGDLIVTTSNCLIQITAF